MIKGAVFLHFGHVASTNAVFFMATLVYVPVAAVCLVAGMDAGARSGVGLALRFMSRYDRLGPAIKAAAFLMVVSSSIDLGYVPSHLQAEPVAAALFSLDAATLVGCSLLLVLMPALRPAAMILLIAGMLAYLLGGVQLDATILAAKAVEGLALALLVAAIVRDRGLPALEAATPPTALPTEAGAAAGAERAGRGARRARGGRKPPRRRAARRHGA